MPVVSGETSGRGAALGRFGTGGSDERYSSAEAEAEMEHVTADPAQPGTAGFGTDVYPAQGASERVAGALPIAAPPGETEAAAPLRESPDVTLLSPATGSGQIMVREGAAVGGSEEDEPPQPPRAVLRNARPPTADLGASTAGSQQLRYEPYPASPPGAGAPAALAGHPAVSTGTRPSAPPPPPPPHPLGPPDRMQQQQQQPQACAPPVPSFLPPGAAYSLQLQQTRQQQEWAEYQYRMQAWAQYGAAMMMAQGRPQPSSQGGGALAVAGAAVRAASHIMQHEGGGREICGDFQLGLCHRDNCKFFHVKRNVQRQPY
eukprot:TRINITY_DN3785_c0_g1_i1.p1 TRINITY_DN3785_c0_g1~~TRINITY_DN3785_c0_g1_i1.p1  ORF type:complete len:352 (+),score=94.67 TRINITY_DN3785_c0_g1_i1:106-1056(+)